MRTIPKFRRTTFLFLILFLLFFTVYFLPRNEPSYRGRTVEQWLRSSDWTTRREYVVLVITELDDQGVAALNRILLKKGAATEESLFTTLPFVRWLNGTRLTRAELKERVITSLESFGMTGMKCIPTVIHVAQNENEPLRVRQVAIKTLSTLPGSSINEALTHLTNDLKVRVDATKALSELERRRQQQRETAEIHALRRGMDSERLRQNELSSRTSLWEEGHPGVTFGK